MLVCPPLTSRGLGMSPECGMTLRPAHQDWSPLSQCRLVLLRVTTQQQKVDPNVTLGHSITTIIFLGIHNKAEGEAGEDG